MAGQPSRPSLAAPHWAYSMTPSQVTPIAAACSGDNVLGLRRRLAIKSRFSWRAPPYRAGGNKVNDADRRVSSMKGADAGLGRLIRDCGPLVLTQVL
jgi:hypothetical protein